MTKSWLVDLECGTDATSAIVLDVGTSSTKIGYSDEEDPRIQLLTAVGIKPRILRKGEQESGDDTIQLRGVYDAFGEEAVKLPDAYYPVVRGQIQKLEILESLLTHLLKTRMKEPSDEESNFTSKSGLVLTKPILIIAGTLWTSQSTTSFVNHIFEAFNPPSVIVASSAVLSMFSTGRTTGIVVEIGEGVTSVVPVYEGFSIPHATFSIEHSGKELTESLINSVNAKLKIQVDRMVGQGMKEKIACAKLPDSITDDCYFEFSEGVKKIPCDLRWQCVEPLFQDDGIPMIFAQAVQAADPAIRSELVSNVVVCGGSSMIYNLPERLKLEFTKMAGMDVKVVSEITRNFSAWLGGSMFASLKNSECYAITRKDKDDQHFPHKFIL